MKCASCSRSLGLGMVSIATFQDGTIRFCSTRCMKAWKGPTKWWMVVLSAGILLVAGFLLTLAVGRALARDDGRYAQSPLKNWFDGLRSKKGLCCSDADGEMVTYERRGNTFYVDRDGKQYEVPEDALILEPNLHGRAMVWWYEEWTSEEGGVFKLHWKIKCFMPGAML